MRKKVPGGPTLRTLYTLVPEIPLVWFVRGYFLLGPSDQATGLKQPKYALPVVV